MLKLKDIDNKLKDMENKFFKFIKKHCLEILFL